MESGIFLAQQSGVRWIGCYAADFIALVVPSALLGCAPVAQARVTRIVIDTPKNANGMVEYMATFFIVKPVDMTRTSDAGASGSLPGQQYLSQNHGTFRLRGSVGLEDDAAVGRHGCCQVYSHSGQYPLLIHPNHHARRREWRFQKAACRWCCETRRSAPISDGTSRRAENCHSTRFKSAIYIGGMIPFAETMVERLAACDLRLSRPSSKPLTTPSHKVSCYRRMPIHC